MDNYLKNILVKLDTLYAEKDMKQYKEVLDSIDTQYALTSELMNYYTLYYWSTYQFEQAYPFIKGYMREYQRLFQDDIFIHPLRELLPTLMYEDILSDDEYTNLIQSVYQLSKPDKENTINIKDSSFFKPLKVGLISYDFKYHPVGLFLMALFADNLNFSTVQYYAYDTNGNINDIQMTISTSVKQYHNVSDCNNDLLTEIIQNDDLDIIIDLSGLSEKNKLDIFSKRLAPIQMSWIGFPGTTACYNMDYVITDKITDPPEKSKIYYTEKLLYLEQTALCFIHDTHVSSIKDISPVISNKFITFGSFVNPHKYSVQLLKMWETILKKIPNSRLLIQSSYFKSERDINIQSNKFSKNGIDISRVTFLESSNYPTYLENYNNVDIVLDTYPFNGATTTCEALSRGVPVITLAGRMHGARVGTSMLTNVGLTELISYSEDEYINKAVELANNIEKLNALRSSIRHNYLNSTLTDHLSFKIDFEYKLRDTYVNYLIEHSTTTVIHEENPQQITMESINSILYIKHIIEHNKSNIFPFIVDESVKVQTALLNLLINLNSDNEKALSLLKRYDTLIKLLNHNADSDSNKIVLDSMLKIIHKFIN